MNRYPEKIPNAVDHRQFPIGDLFEGELKSAHDLLFTLQSGDTDQQIKNIQMMRNDELSSWRSMTGQNAIYGDLHTLFDSWSQCYPNPKKANAVAQIGGLSTLAFISKSNLLPTLYDDFSEEIAHMRTYDAQNIRDVANDSWALMHHSHPEAYSALAPFIRHLSQLNGISPEYDEQSLELLEATAALPYLMACTTRMTAYLKNDMKFFRGEYQMPPM